MRTGVITECAEGIGGRIDTAHREIGCCDNHVFAEGDADLIDVVPGKSLQLIR